MARGFLSGVLWGGVVGVGVSAAASVLAPPPVAPQVSDVAPDGTQVPARIEDATSSETASTADRTVVTGTVAPQAPMPALDSGVALDSAALTSPSQPDTGTPTALTDPQAASDTTGISAATDEAVIPTPQALAPMEPQEPDAAQIDTTPAQPPAPEVVQTEAPAQPEAEVAQDDVPVVAEDTGEQVADAEQPEAVAIGSEAPLDTPGETQETAQTDTQDDTQTAALAPETILEPVAPPTSVTQEDTTTDEDNTSPRIGQPVGTLGDRDTGVTIRRPSSASLGEIDDGAAEEVAVDAGAAPVSDDPRPISRFSAAFTAEEGKPLMAIVLIDDGSSPVTGAAGIAALRGFPYPLSFAVDSNLNDATERMDLYRKEGFEVLALIDLPEGAQPSDAETTFGVVLPQMSDVVGVLEGTAGGLQGSREVSDQVTSILLQTGHGLLAQDRGLNTMPKLARKEGVPADPIFRDFDSNGQSASVIRRFLDQAAFKAGQEGAVVMLGRLRPDTISALLLWGLQDRAGKVSLAPISAVLLREE